MCQDCQNCQTCQDWQEGLNCQEWSVNTWKLRIYCIFLLYFLMGGGGVFKSRQGEESLSVKSGQIWLLCSLSAGCVIEEEIVYWGHDIKGKGSHNVKVKNQQACATLAATIEGALFWTYRPKDKKCFVKNSKEGRRAHAGRVSGSVACGKCACDSFIDQ